MNNNLVWDQKDIEEWLENVVEELGVKMVIGYGSGIIRQGGSATVGMADVLAVVDDAAEYHRKAMGGPRSLDYPLLLRTMGWRAASSLHRWGAHVMYVPDVWLAGRWAKYGLVERTALLRDLQDWETFYLAGRLCKPVRTAAPSDEVAEAIERSRAAALQVAAVLLQDADSRPFSNVELWRSVAGLSYGGDVRSGWAEHPLKVHNLVEGVESDYAALYNPANNRWLRERVRCLDDGRWEMEPLSAADAERWLRSLPAELSRRALLLWPTRSLPSAVRLGLQSIVRESSSVQSLLGFFSAGPLKSFKYLARKVSKRFSHL